MGEIAEAMLDGELCEMCGVYMGGPVGHPRICGGCQHDIQQPPPYSKVHCKQCKKLINAIGLKDHVKDAHGVTGGATK